MRAAARKTRQDHALHRIALMFALMLRDLWTPCRYLSELVDDHIDLEDLVPHPRVLALGSDPKEELTLAKH